MTVSDCLACGSINLLYEHGENISKVFSFVLLEEAYYDEYTGYHNSDC